MTAPDLTLPGAIPGLLRRGSPVVVLRGRWAGHLGVVVVAGRWADAALADEEADSVLTFGLDELALDLTDATGRAHAAWWLEDSIARDAWLSKPLMSTAATPKLAWFASRPGRFFDAVADLDPDDPRLLPDGSRWVDAEALRRVVLRVHESAR